MGILVIFDFNVIKGSYLLILKVFINDQTNFNVTTECLIFSMRYLRWAIEVRNFQMNSIY